MKTKKCEEMMARFLTGQVSEEMEQHFRECPECRALASLDRKLAESHGRLAVPLELDRTVLAYAAAKKRPAQRTWNIAFILHHAAYHAWVVGCDGVPAFAVGVGSKWVCRVVQNGVKQFLRVFLVEKQHAQFPVAVALGHGLLVSVS